MFDRRAFEKNKEEKYTINLHQYTVVFVFDYVNIGIVCFWINSSSVKPMCKL